MPIPCGHDGTYSRCALCRLYRTRPDYRRLWDGPSALVGAQAAPTACRWRGQILEPAPCSCPLKHVHECLYEGHDHDRCTVGPNNGTMPSCGACLNRDKAVATEGVGVVIGSYGWPNLNELQVKVTRRLCGDVPMLLADDCSPDGEAIEKVAARYEGVTAWVSHHRKGHYAGDLSVFGKGLQWAQTLGLKWLCKLSQRFVWQEPDWLARAVKTLDGSGHSILMQRCLDSGKQLYIRSECVLLKVDNWAPLWHLFDRPKLTNATELYLWHLVHAHFAGKYCEWPGMPEDRTRRMPGTVWHCTHGDQDFVRLFREYGLEPDVGFSVAGRPSLKDSAGQKYLAG